MPVESPTREPPPTSAFPEVQLETILHKELEEAADESGILHGGWEPVLDSLRIVTIVSTLERLFDFPLPPEKVVKKGGYKSVDEAFENVKENLRGLWNKHHK
jgi:acyl carrier protein